MAETLDIFKDMAERFHQKLCKHATPLSMPGPVVADCCTCTAEALQAEMDVFRIEAQKRMHKLTVEDFASALGVPNNGGIEEIVDAGLSQMQKRCKEVAKSLAVDPEFTPHSSVYVATLIAARIGDLPLHGPLQQGPEDRPSDETVE